MKKILMFFVFFLIYAIVLILTHLFFLIDIIFNFFGKLFTYKYRDKDIQVN